MNNPPFYNECLKRELARRCDRNPKYSVRAYARSLGVDVGALSRVLAGKQIPSPKLAQKILSHLALPPEQQARFISSLVDTHRARGLERLSPMFKRAEGVAVPTELSIELYRVIADWYHVAILELTFTREFKTDPRWIASELAISPVEAKLALERLFALGLLEEQGGKVRKSQEQLTTANKELTTAALKKNQRQFLEKALDSLENDPIEVRNHSSMTMAIDPEKIPVAKKMIREFNQTLCQFLESGNGRRQVYNLSVALFPLQKVKDLKEEKQV